MPARLPPFPYLVNVSRDGMADEAIFRARTREWGEWLVDHLAADQPGVFRLTHYRRPATLYSAGTPAGE